MRKIQFARTLALGVMATFISTSALAGAPLGTYTATLGETTARAGGVLKGSGKRRAAPASQGADAAQTITVRISSYSPEQEIDQLKAAAQESPERFFKTLNGFSHGTVTIAGRSYPINAAHSTREAGGKYLIALISAEPIKKGTRRTLSSAGNYGSMVKLTVDVSGAGEGKLYYSAQVTVKQDGTFVAGGRASTATPLHDVSRQ